MVSTDHYIPQSIVSIYYTKGNLYPHLMFSYGCVFVDHVSGLMSINHQVYISDTKTVNDILNFERESQSQGVDIKE